MRTRVRRPFRAPGARTGVTAAAVATAAALAAAQGASADAAHPAEVLRTLDHATVVGAGGGWTVWSERADGQSRFRLVVRDPDGEVSRPSVRTRGVPFDVDVGTDADRRPVVTFSRCAGEPTRIGGANATGPQWASGRSCRASVLRLGGSAERRLPRGRTTGGDLLASEVLPSMARGKLVTIGLRTSSSRVANLFVHVRRRGERVVRPMDSGARTTGGAAVSVSSGPASVDTDGTRAVVLWRAQDTEFNSFDAVVRTSRLDLRGRPRQITSSTNNDVCEYEQVLAPTLAGGRVVSLRTDGYDWSSESRTLTGSGLRYGPFVDLPDAPPDATDDPPGDVVVSAAVDGDRLVVSETASTITEPAAATVVTSYPLAPLGTTRPPVGAC